MQVSWSTDPDTRQPVAEIMPDSSFDGSRLQRITGVNMAWGSFPITVTFFYEGNVDLAMREIVEELGQAGAIIGSFRDSRTGASWR